MNSKSSDILLSICCTAYNLEKYIAKAIDSFLEQRTNFRFEIIIGEDCSKDSTREIISAYCREYPELIQMVISDENVGIIRNFNRILEKAKGKYIAICDGDDFWSDPLKLQKQVDFLENNEDYVMCCHYSNLVDETGAVTYVDPEPKPLIYTYFDILTGKRTETRNSTMVIRNNSQFKQLTKQAWFLGCYAQDRFIKLFATSSTGGKIYVLPEVMGNYRIHQASIWSTAGSKVVGRKTRSDFNVIINNFKYPKEQQKKLLEIYLKRYLAYDIKKLGFRKIYSTFNALLISK